MLTPSIASAWLPVLLWWWRDPSEIWIFATVNLLVEAFVRLSNKDFLGAGPFFVAGIFGEGILSTLGTFDTCFGPQAGNIAITCLGQFASPYREESCPLVRNA